MDSLHLQGRLADSPNSKGMSPHAHIHELSVAVAGLALGATALATVFFGIDTTKSPSSTEPPKSQADREVVVLVSPEPSEQSDLTTQGAVQGN